MEIQIEFGGFYGFHDEYIENRIEIDNDFSSGNDIDHYLDIENVDWNATFKDYAENWLWRFNTMSGLGLGFAGLDSPKYYNYRTDRIVAYVDKDDMGYLMNFVNDDDFLMWANPKLQSRSGFISFYNGIDDLIERAKNDDDDKANLLGMVCNYLIELNEVNEDIYELEYDIIELNDKITENE